MPTTFGSLRRVLLAVMLALSIALMLLGGTAKASTNCTSAITSVSNFNTSNHQTVYITGRCFGTIMAYNNMDSYYFRIHAYNGQLGGWNACGNGDYVTCSVSYWSGNSIVFKGFGAWYGRYGWSLYMGEELAIFVANPQNSVWYTCTVYVGRTSSCSEF